MAELVVIAPTSSLRLTYGLKYQWAYSSRLKTEKYKEFYGLQSDHDHYVILQQDERIPPTYLAQLAEDIGAREVVLPFVGGDSPETSALVKETLAGIAANRVSFEIFQGLRPHIMIVPQGIDVFYWSQCIKEAIQLYYEVKARDRQPFPFPPVIGVSTRFLGTLSRDDLQTARAVLLGMKLRYRIESHLMDWAGASTFGIPWRSVSTMTPFTLAANQFNGASSKVLDRRFTAEEENIAQIYIKKFKTKV